VVHNVTAATRLFDVLPLVAADQRIQVIFSVIGSSTFTTGTENFLLDRGAAPIPWSRIPDQNRAVSRLPTPGLRGKRQ
jgi:hypothetical protein